jgi:hypothetical protein
MTIDEKDHIKGYISPKLKFSSRKSHDLVKNIKSISGSKNRKTSRKNYEKRINDLKANINDVVKNMSFNRRIKLKNDNLAEIESIKKGFLYKISMSNRVSEIEKGIENREKDSSVRFSENRDGVSILSKKIKENILGYSS